MAHQYADKIGFGAAGILQKYCAPFREKTGEKYVLPVLTRRCQGGTCAAVGGGRAPGDPLPPGGRDTRGLVPRPRHEARVDLRLLHRDQVNRIPPIKAGRRCLDDPQEAGAWAARRAERACEALGDLDLLTRQTWGAIALSVKYGRKVRA